MMVPAAAPYFREVCSKTLQAYFEILGFQPQPESDDVMILFAQDNVFIRLEYWPEDEPRFVMQGAIGFIRPGRALNGSRLFDGVALWRFVPDWAPHRWTFSNGQQLEVALTTIRDHLLEPIARPIWENRPKLEAMVAKYRHSSP